MRYKGTKGKCWEVVKRICKKRDGDKCYTCPKKGSEWKWDAGHYRPVAVVGSNNKRCWDMRFIRRQCISCNGQGQGEQAVYRRNLVLELGEAPVALFDALVASRKPDPVKNWDVLLSELSQALEALCG